MMNILAVDVGGTHVKIMVTGQPEERKMPAGPDLTAQQMVDGVIRLAEGWTYEAVSIGFPGPVLHGKPLQEPVNLGQGWVGFDFEAAFGCPVKMVNDATMQALGSYEGGRMLFLGLGTGLGTAMIVDGIIEPMELAHLPYKKGRTFEDYVGLRGLERLGEKKWQQAVADVVARLKAALEPDYIVLGGGNVHRLKTLPPDTRRGDNSHAFRGGFRLWDEEAVRDQPDGGAPAGAKKQPSTQPTDLDQLTINTIRTLAMDAVQAANSGHPGTPMALAPVAYCLWQQFLRFDPEDPIWPNRDRFVLSNGHASMLLYALLHLTGVKAVNPAYETPGEPAVTLDDIKNFRQLGSKCPGHPEYRWTSGVETTTGPLGQGVATSVGMAIAGGWLANQFNRPDFEMFDYNVYALCGDGCMMEGISGEAASLAGHLKLSNLCWIYDNNHITIEGHTALAFSEDVATRFLGYGWNVLRVGDANDLAMLAQAFETFKKTTDRPTLIIVDSHIGYGAPHKQDTSAAHGEPLGEDEIRLAKRGYGWPEDAKFYIPEAVPEHFRRGIGQRGKSLREAWLAKFEAYRTQYPDQANQLHRMQTRRLPDGWDQELPHFPADEKGLAGRDASAQVLNAIALNVPWLLGGAADLAPSTKTRLTFAGAGDFEAETYGGRNFHFGIREHAMAAIVNGMSLSKVRPYGSTFFTFCDYARPAIRLSALMELPTIYIFTHDSIGVGEDGPTHQPVEQLASLRAIPGLIVLRPADANEVVEAWRVIMPLRHRPVALILTRQSLPTLDRTRYAPAGGLAQGAYILADADDGQPEVLLLATGSEVQLCVQAYEELKAEGIKARVVSMPSWELFEEQSQEYQDSVIPPDITARVAVEQASTLGWERYVGRRGQIIGMHTFGASAPLKALQQKFGFEPEHIVTAAKAQLKDR
jgi:transketolase